jgi:hypothetical protein
MTPIVAYLVTEECVGPCGHFDVRYSVASRFVQGFVYSVDNSIFVDGGQPVALAW